VTATPGTVGDAGNGLVVPKHRHRFSPGGAVSGFADLDHMPGEERTLGRVKMALNSNALPRDLSDKSV